MAIPVILDCDPGHDDALAIVLVLHRPELDLLALTTVGGNALLERVTENALRVLALAGRPDVPVAAGAAVPLRGVEPIRTAPHVHGESGIEGAELPEPAAAALEEDAQAVLRRLLRDAPEPVTLVATGPLTNVALLLQGAPELHDRIARIVLMGGAIDEGNITPSAEFNIWADPEAARVVVRSGLAVTMVPLDVTHQALIRGAEISLLRSRGGARTAVIADLLDYFQRFHERFYGWPGVPVHDAVCVAHVAVPDLLETERYPVDVEVAGELTRGRTVVDRHGATGAAPNVDVAVGIDRERFRDLLFDAVLALDAEAGARAAR
jgi:inosine-uridine nucleoside N-ribohydrolase